MEFYFTKDWTCIDKVIEEAEEYIKIVEFQFSNSEYITKLIQKAKNVDITVITLPIDSIWARNEEELKRRNKIQELYDHLEKTGRGKIYDCMWEVGDPTLTTTSESGNQSEGGGEKWYSLHGKFIVTDKHALITSANLIDKKEFDVYLLYSDKLMIDLLNKKFDWLKTHFTKINNHPGKILDFLPTQEREEIWKEYKNDLNPRLNIRNYPDELTQTNSQIKRGIYITPFDGRARIILNQLIEDAEEFVYLLSERLYDDQIVTQIKHKMLNSKVDIKLITGPPESVRQNVNKAREYFMDLGSVKAKIRAKSDIHAKCWLTEKWLVVGSANLGKMNLGFGKGGGWRANTEIIMLENNPEIIKKAKSIIDEVHNTSDTLIDVLATSAKAKSISKGYFDLFDHSSRNEAKLLFGRLRLKFAMETEQKIIIIARYSTLLAKRSNNRYVEKVDVIMGTILMILKERGSTQREIIEILGDVISEQDIKRGLSNLQQKKLIEEEKEKFEINIDTLLSNPQVKKSTFFK